jgi:predicted nucleic acid-binding Zn ribbon protein
MELLIMYTHMQAKVEEEEEAAAPKKGGKHTHAHTHAHTCRPKVRRERRQLPLRRVASPSRKVLPLNACARKWSAGVRLKMRHAGVCTVYVYTLQTL